MHISEMKDQHTKKVIKIITQRPGSIILFKQNNSNNLGEE
jgi:hypothetical protein